MTIPSPSAARRQTASAALLTIAACLGLLSGPGCQSTPISGRQQLVLIPEAQEIQLGKQAFEQTMAEEPVSQDAEITAMVERVGRRIAEAAGKPEYDWEFRVIARGDQNAFALPGGKVAVYEGILPVCQSEAGLAVVMSHEIAHALARHGGERMSQQAVVDGVGSVVDAISRDRADEATAEKIMQVYGVTSQYGAILPFSRKHESEADAIGLILMARAGYDPSVAPEFWERFAAASGNKPPEWLSTHPADARRAADLRELLPEAMKYYEAAGQQYGMGDPIPLDRLARSGADNDPARSGAVSDADNDEVQQVTRATPRYVQNYGSISALTGPGAVKKEAVTGTYQVESADEARPADESAADIQPVSAEVLSYTSTNFQMPRTEDPGAVEPAESDGWGPSRGTDRK